MEHALPAVEIDDATARRRASGRISSKRWNEKNSERSKEYKYKSYERNKTDSNKRAIARMFLKKYGITIAQRDAILAEQGGVCAICKSDKTGSKRDWHMDHRHEPHQIRGVLCHQCNLVVGFCKEREDVLLAAIEYLRRYASWV